MKIIPLTCPVCLKPKPKALWDKEVKEGAFHYFFCPQCDTVFISPWPQKIEALYDRQYYGPDHRRFIGAIELMVRAFCYYRTLTLKRYLKDLAGKNILDIGCGRGILLKELSKKGAHCYGTEINRAGSQRAAQNQNLHISIGDIWEIGYPANFFEAVTLFQVLEHISNPHRLFGTLSEILKPGGYAIITTPNIKSLQASLGQKDWFHLDAPRHLILYSKKGLKSLADRYGLQPISESTFCLEQNPFGLWQTLLNRIFPKKDLLYSFMRHMTPVEIRRHFFYLGIAGLLLPGSVITSLGSSFFGYGGTLELIFQRRS